MLEADILKKLLGRDAGPLVEHPLKMIRADMHVLGRLLERGLLLKILHVEIDSRSNSLEIQLLLRFHVVFSFLRAKLPGRTARINPLLAMLAGPKKNFDACLLLT